MSVPTTGPDARRGATDVVCFSLEAWDEVWRRNQHLTTALLGLRPELRILFSELPTDVLFGLAHRSRPAPSTARRLGETGRLWAVRPRKWLPRRVHPSVDRLLTAKVLDVARSLGLDRPVLWVNDSAYAEGVVGSGLPVLYDVTDDWNEGHALPGRFLTRHRANDELLTRRASEVVVCSPSLQATRGRRRAVHLIPNAVDVEHFRTRRERPGDLPAGPVVLYHGTLAAGRLDLDLCCSLGEGLGDRARLVLLGPNSLSTDDSSRLTRAGVVLLGGRPYDAVPAYLQHADVLAVPHLVNAFTESLDPIKARELMAVGRPTVATPVAGLRDIGPPVLVAEPADFVGVVVALLAGPPPPEGPGPLRAELGSWTDRAAEFLAVLDAAAAEGGPGS